MTTTHVIRQMYGSEVHLKEKTMSEVTEDLKLTRKMISNLRSIADRMAKTRDRLEGALGVHQVTIEDAEAGRPNDNIPRATLALLAALMDAQMAALDLGVIQVTQATDQFEKMLASLEIDLEDDEE
jgi:hypothetical protein